MRTNANPEPEVIYRDTKHVRQRYGGCSDMTIWRWLRDADLGFPQPIYIGRRRFWRETDLARWERERAAATTKVHAGADALEVATTQVAPEPSRATRKPSKTQPAPNAQQADGGAA